MKQGDLVIVSCEDLSWTRQRYATNDIGIIISLIDYPTYYVAMVKLFRNQKTETIPLEYLSLLGEEE